MKLNDLGRAPGNKQRMQSYTLAYPWIKKDLVS